MKIYRVSKLERDGGHDGYLYLTNKTAAQKRQQEENKIPTNRNDGSVEEINFTPTKSGILKMLNTWAAHPDNG